MPARASAVTRVYEEHNERRSPPRSILRRSWDRSFAELKRTFEDTFKKLSGVTLVSHLVEVEGTSHHPIGGSAIGECISTRSLKSIRLFEQLLR